MSDEHRETAPGGSDPADTRPGRPTIDRLYRYPVKGLSPQPLSSLELTAGQGVPFDRVFALARPDTNFDESQPAALPKTTFFMLQRDEVLARIRSSYDPSSGQLSLVRGRQRLIADLSDAEARSAVEKFVATVLGTGPGEGMPRLVSGRGGHRFTDAGTTSAEFMQAVSVVNLASVRQLEERTGTRIDPLRFRANVYLDGIEPWAELEWAGEQIGLGSVNADVLARTPRCAATSVNPNTGERDVNVLKQLATHYGHTHCGFYVSVRTSGTIRPGDVVTIPAC